MSTEPHEGKLMYTCFDGKVVSSFMLSGYDIKQFLLASISMNCMLACIDRLVSGVSGNPLPLRTSYREFELRPTHKLRLFSWLNALVAVLLTFSFAGCTVITLGTTSTGSQHLSLHSTGTISMNIISVWSIWRCGQPLLKFLAMSCCKLCATRWMHGIVGWASASCMYFSHWEWPTPFGEIL